MEMETKFLRLFKRANLGDGIDGWRVCWGWRMGQVPDRIVFVVMVERPLSAAGEKG
jgi:hypothetical protein